MSIQKDKSGNTYVEEDFHGEHIRLTYVEKSGAWSIGTPTVRIQIRNEKGSLRPGPEIPVEILGNIAGNMLDLLLENKKSIGQELLVGEILTAVFGRKESI